MKKRESTKKKRAKNPAPKKRRKYKRTVHKKTYIICARKSANSPKMHFDGTHFTQRREVKSFLTAKAASDKARELLRKHSVLRKYRITVEDSHRPE